MAGNTLSAFRLSDLRPAQATTCDSVIVLILAQYIHFNLGAASQCFRSAFAFCNLCTVCDTLQYHNRKSMHIIEAPNTVTQLCT